MLFFTFYMGYRQASSPRKILEAKYDFLNSVGGTKHQFLKGGRANPHPPILIRVLRPCVILLSYSYEIFPS